MPVKRLKEHLDSRGVRYVTVTHSAAFTAQEIAASAHIPGRQLAKTVMVKVDGKMYMAVLPATHAVDLDRLKQAMAASKAELAREEEFRDLFPECEVGAMPPFGSLYGMEVLADRSLSQGRDIAFNAGSHRELVRMAYRDYERLVRPRVEEFAKRLS